MPKPWQLLSTASETNGSPDTSVKKARTMAALTSLMTRFCAGEDSWLACSSTNDPSTSEVRDGNGKPRRNKNKRRNKEGSPDNTVVNARFRGSRPGQRKKPFKGSREGQSGLNKILEKLCQIHGTPDKPANHTHRECWVFKQAGKLPNTKGRRHQMKTRMNLASKEPEDKKSSHQRLK